MKLSRLFPLLALLAFGQCAAGSYPCTGKVDLMFVTRSGNVELYSAGVYGGVHGRFVCNVTAAWKGVSPETCRAWYATMLSQISRGKPVKLYYITEEAASCSTTPLYGDSVPPYGVSDQ